MLLQIIFICTLEIFESQEHCLHDWSQVVAVGKNEGVLLIQNEESIYNTYVSGKIQNQNTVDLGVECVLQRQIYAITKDFFVLFSSIVLIHVNHFLS